MVIYELLQSITCLQLNVVLELECDGEETTMAARGS
jgi:hypothetical protein